MSDVRLRSLVLIAISSSLVWTTAVGAHDPIANNLTWVDDIAPIFQAHCVECHKSGSVAPMPLTTYEEVRPWTAGIRIQVLNRTMPIWHAARGYGEFLNDPSLSSFDVALISQWVNTGAPQGDARKEPRPLSPKSPVRPMPARSALREQSVTCGAPQGVSGRLLAVTPQLEKGESAMITALLPSGARHVVAWIRDFDPRFPATYWLRAPITLPAGSRVELDQTAGKCTLSMSLAR